MIVLNGKEQIIGTFHAYVPFETKTFQAPAIPPVSAVVGDYPTVADHEAIYHLVTFEKGRYQEKGRTVRCLKIIGGEEHIDDVRAFSRADGAGPMP